MTKRQQFSAKALHQDVYKKRTHVHSKFNVTYVTRQHSTRRYDFLAIVVMANKHDKQNIQARNMIDLSRTTNPY